jgi:flagellar basal-body rod protein FlgB
VALKHVGITIAIVFMANKRFTPMNLPELPLLSMLRQRMGWLNQRQSVLSQNVVNADTPGYTARDLKPVDFAKALAESSSGRGNAMRATDPRHITISPGAQQGFEDFQSNDVEASPNGNSVSLEMEMIKVSDTQAQFQAAANLYAKAMGMMKTAIGH